MTKLFIYISIIMSSLLILSCDDDDNPEIPNEEELITSVTYLLTPLSGGAPVTLSFLDEDGDGGDPPVIVGGTLSANTTYSGQLDLLNTLENPAESITMEVAEEDDEHQFFFDTSGGLNLDVMYADQDDDGNPLGLATEIETGAASSGSLTVTLRHEPDKFADGVSEGNIANAGGETDIEITFDITIQ